MQCLVGNEQQDCPLPVTLTENEYTQLVDAAKELDLETSLIDQCYNLGDTGYMLTGDRYHDCSVQNERNRISYICSPFVCTSILFFSICIFSINMYVCYISQVNDLFFYLY